MQVNDIVKIGPKSQVFSSQYHDEKGIVRALSSDGQLAYVDVNGGSLFVPVIYLELVYRASVTGPSVAVGDEIFDNNSWASSVEMQALAESKTLNQ